MTEPTIRAVISYTRGASDAHVIALADRLNREGVECELDLYDGAPPEGWARWMGEMMMQRTVLVIASEAYYRRYHRKEPAGIGLGATFETGLLAQRVLEMQGKNEGVIPVLFATRDAQYIPEFLRDVQRYDLSEPDGYEQLYRRLTGQPEYVKPPLGEMRVLRPKNPPLPNVEHSATYDPAMVLFHSDEGMFGIRAQEIERGQGLKMTLLPDDDAGIAMLRGLQRQQRLGLAYGSTALFAHVKGISEKMSGGTQRYELDLLEELVDNSFGSEMSYNGISSDQIATMRARRILLDEELELPGQRGSAGGLNDDMLESFVAGRIVGGNRLTVTRSPIPAIARSPGVSATQRSTIARLACVLLLVLSGTIERIKELDLRFSDDGVDVRFDGVRHKVYSNREATAISVVGTCPV